MLKNENYSLLSKLLHGLALGNNFIPEMLHDIEIALLKKKINSDNLTPHIFISGMARSGSTILMRFLYQTKFFASFTYRDMPFVMSPNLWSKISNKIKPKSHKERIHGDSISINIDSPEALEEVFWRVKLQKNYIYTNKLNAHEADDFTIDEFRNLISLILYRYKKKIYLSKNNNNILRLSSIIKAFPNSLILVPFRDPIQQAKSLLTQHENFSKIQKVDKFIKKYMSYLVHHEFGIIHKPFDFNQNHNISYNINSLEYWLFQWVNVYRYLSQEKFINKKNIIYINYEFLCDNPKKILSYISSKINTKDLLLSEDYNFEKSQKIINIKENDLLIEAQNIFNKLKSNMEIV